MSDNNLEKNTEEKKQVRLCHTWWSLPMRQGRWNKPHQIEDSIYITALSVAYAKLNGAKIVCYCDSYIKPYLEKLGYDELFVELDGIENEMNPARKDTVLMWAAGKFYALAKEPIGSVQIDFDVFLKKPESIEALDFHNYDILYSHIEPAIDYQERLILRDYIPTIDCNNEFAANVGVLGFNNQDAKDQYLNHYLYYYRSLDFDNNGDKDINADLLLEQIYLLQMLESYTSVNLIGDQRVNSVYDLQKNAMTIGYVHLFGRTKYTPYIINRVKKKLQEIAPEVYDEITKMEFEGF